MKSRTLTLAPALLALAATTASAATINVANPSFETDAVANGTNTNAAPTDWSMVGSGGTLDRNSGTFATAIDPTPDAGDGEQMAWSNGGDFYQALGANLEANTEYKLTVDVGDRTDTGFPGGELRLGTGGTFGANLLSAPLSVNKPVANGAGASDGWETWTTTFSTGAGGGVVGDPLRVELLSNGVQALFDNVRLESTAVSAPLLSIPLQNATADFSQSGFTVDQSIDGNLSTTTGGWAFNAELGSAHTAVYETTADLPLSELTLTVLQRSGFELKDLRFSVTQDDRSLFADGLFSGGDVTATWTVLDPLTAVNLNGGTSVIDPDGTIGLVNEGSLWDRFTFNSPFGDITGLRVEVFPVGGSVGYAGGNAVLAEFQVAAREIIAIPEPSRALLLGLGGLALILRRRKG